MVPSDILPNFLGDTVDGGRLQLIERLGSGAYGMVYKALDRTSPADRPVYFAVKCIKKYPVGTREAVFQARELKLHKMVSSHPNVLTIHRHFSEGKHIFIVLDFCAGGDLFVAITEKHRFRRNTVLLRQAFIQLLDAVQHCHNNNVFHRDLKPENILYDNHGGNIWLADFGLSTQSGMCSDHGLGSPYYMSPEAHNAEYTHGGYSTRHCDIWALGVILTNMICGRHPWKTAEPTDECFAAFLTDNDFLLRALPISKGVNTILKRCFRLHPPARPSISQIREEVLKLDTFFLSDTELAAASSSQRAIAQYYADPTPEGELSSGSDREGTLCDDPNASASRVSSIDPEEVYIYPVPPFDSPRLLAPPGEARFPGDSFSVSASDVSSDSGVDSNGPITPATHPVDPIDIVEVPDLPEDQNINESAAFPSPDRVQAPSQATYISVPDGSEIAKPRSLFKRAMKRIRAMGI
ncbi:serine/threonine protein kinase, negative regulator of sexual conjugation and meiosis [Mycena latifolia]|nr:serine/threonine protein kinase, negative regulator of sexual conjugation and meiosis [Mycena latifolia]